MSARTPPCLLAAVFGLFLCLGGVASAAARALPVVTSAPKLSGGGTVGTSLRSSKGTWLHAPSSYAFAWQSCDASGANCSTVAGATTNTLQIGSALVGRTLRAVVTAANGTGSASALSNLSAVVPIPAAPPPPVSPSTYPVHTNIVSTTFWVGEIFNASIADGSQVCSTYDSLWAFHWSGGVNAGADASTDCTGSPIGGCDGVPSGSGSTFKCVTQVRTAANNYFPTSPLVHPAENPFYLDLPFDDVNDKTAYAERCRVIPWASQYPASDCANPNFSYMKNRWVKVTDTSTGHTCFGQIADAGPSRGTNYHDATYVFGITDARPLNRSYSGDPTQGDGMDVSPALNGCLGFNDLDGDNDHVNWQFVDAPQVPAGPWTILVTSSGITE